MLKGHECWLRGIFQLLKKDRFNLEMLHLRAYIFGATENENTEKGARIFARIPFSVFSFSKFYSDFNDLTGFIKAALMAWKLTVNKVIAKAPTPANTKIHHEISVR